MELNHLLENNRRWAEERQIVDSTFFQRLARQQAPEFLWIGCSDSRIPANQVIGLDPGEVFVHRNVANLVLHSDINCLSVIQFAVEFLKVKHIIVCGHYGCAGVKAAMEPRQLGLVDNWLRNIRDVYAESRDELVAIHDPAKRYDRLTELNVVHQVRRVCQTTFVQNAWAAGAPLRVHGWVYRLDDGIIQDLKCSVSGIDQLEEIYHTERSNHPNG